MFWMPGFSDLRKTFLKARKALNMPLTSEHLVLEMWPKPKPVYPELREVYERNRLLDNKEKHQNSN